MLARFEKNFNHHETGGKQHVRPERISEEPKLKSSKPDLKEYEPDLRILWEELINHVLRLQNKAPLSNELRNAGFADVFIGSGISRQFFKNELRAVLSNLRNPGEHNSTYKSTISSSEQVSLRSTKRLLTERTEELEILKKRNKQIDNSKYRLEEMVEHLGKSFEDCKTLHVPMEEEVLELREEKAILNKKSLDLEEASKRFNSERARFQSTISRYREELLLATHQTETAQLEAKQATSRAREIEKRATEAKASSSAVSARVKELQEVQDAMVDIMKVAKESGDTTPTPAVQRNLADLGERRSRLVGRIANLLTKNRKTGNDNGAKDPTTTRTDSGNSNIDSLTPRNETTIADSIASPQNNTGSSSEAVLGSSGADGASRKPLLDGIRRFGSELTRAGTNRTAKTATKSLLANVEKSRLAIENDAILREVIEMKEKEVERLEDELYAARDKAASLEMSLQQERHKRRLDNRTINSKTGEQTQSKENLVLASRNKTLFEWQSKASDEISPVGIQREGFTARRTTIEHTEDRISGEVL